MDSSSKFFFLFSVNYAMIVKLVDLIVLLGSKLLNRFRKFSTRQQLRKDDWGRSWKDSRVNTDGNGRMDLYGNSDKNQTWNNKDPSLHGSMQGEQEEIFGLDSEQEGITV